MTIEFEKNTLRYLFSNKTEFIEQLTPDIFQVQEHRALMQLLKDYLFKYKNLPEKNNFLEYSKGQGLDVNGYQVIKDQMYWLYEPLADVKFVEEKLLDQAKRMMAKNLAKALLTDLDADKIDLDSYLKSLSKITSLTNNVQSSGTYLLADLNKYVARAGKAHPTFIHGLNAMMSTGGFRCPELITFLGMPKSFKTGFLLKFAIEYMKDGLNVMYADFENGEDQIHQRFKQGLLECTIDEIQDFNSELNQLKNNYLNLIGSGDVFIKGYQKRKDHFGNIETDIDRQAQAGKKPDFIVYDYINIMGCDDKGIKDPRLILQHNYAAAQRVNNTYETFCFTVAKMKQSALKKDFPTMDDVAEDFEIIYNSHGVFAIMRNEEDIEKGLGSIVPIVTRQGVSMVKIRSILHVDPAKFIIKEL